MAVLISSPHSFSCPLFSFVVLALWTILIQNYAAIMGIEYAAIPQSAEGSGGDDEYALNAGDDTNTSTGTGTERTRRMSSYEYAKRALILFNLLMFGLIMGFCVGRQHPAMNAMGGGGETTSETDGLLPPSAFVPDSEYALLFFYFIFFNGRNLCDGKRLVVSKGN